MSAWTRTYVLCLYHCRTPLSLVRRLPFSGGGLEVLTRTTSARGSEKEASSRCTCCCMHCLNLLFCSSLRRLPGARTYTEIRFSQVAKSAIRVPVCLHGCLHPCLWWRHDPGTSSPGAVGAVVVVGGDDVSRKQQLRGGAKHELVSFLLRSASIHLLPV